MWPTIAKLVGIFLVIGLLRAVGCGGATTPQTPSTQATEAPSAPSPLPRMVVISSEEVERTLKKNSYVVRYYTDLETFVRCLEANDKEALAKMMEAETIGRTNQPYTVYASDVVNVNDRVAVVKVRKKGSPTELWTPSTSLQLGSMGKE